MLGIVPMRGNFPWPSLSTKDFTAFANSQKFEECAVVWTDLGSFSMSEI